MESSPASSFEMGEAEFALEFLIVAFDAPAQFRGIDENFDRSVFGQGRESQYLVGSRSSSGHSISSHSSGGGAVSLPSRVAGRIRTAGEKGSEVRVWLEPSRQDTYSPGAVFSAASSPVAPWRDRPIIGVAPCARGLAPASAPGLGRQRLHARRPDADRRLHGHRIGQPHLCDAGAESAHRTRKRRRSRTIAAAHTPPCRGLI